jgi:sialic acid synthase SpsE
LYELYKMAHTPWDWREPIIKRATELGLIWFSTPFDNLAVDFLETLDIPAYKISSFENTHLPLLKKVASTGKPIIISTGMATIGELEETLRTIQESGCTEFALLKCASKYPALPQDSHILTVPHMRTLFDCEIGLSDHTTGRGSAIAAVAPTSPLLE